MCSRIIGAVVNGLLSSACWVLSCYLWHLVFTSSREAGGGGGDERCRTSLAEANPGNTLSRSCFVKIGAHFLCVAWCPLQWVQAPPSTSSKFLWQFPLRSSDILSPLAPRPYRRNEYVIYWRPVFLGVLVNSRPAKRSHRCSL